MNPNNMLINTLLNKLQAQNPQGYQQVISAMNSGQSPEKIVQQMLSSGQITNAQLQQAQQMARNLSSNNQTPNNQPKRF